MIEVLISPGKFFDKLDSFGYKVVALVALLTAIPSAITQYILLSHILNLFPENIRPFIQISSIFGLVFSFVAVFIMILIVAGIVHLISGVFGGEGEFVKTATVIGYGMIPSAIIGFINIGILLYSLSQIGEFSSIKELIAFFTDQTRLMSSVILTAAGGFWSIAIMSAGISRIRNLEYSKALISCLIPFLLYIGYTLYSIYSITSLGQLGELSSL